MKNLSSSAVLIISVLVGVVLLGVLVFAARNAEKSAETATLPISFEEFSDFECPACASFYPLVEQIRDEFGDDVAFEYKHFPLTTIHPNAYSAAVASEAAREQGKFEEFYDRLFEEQKNLSQELYVSIAEEIGLNVEQFQSDLQNPVVVARVDADIAEGNQRNVNATPTFFIDGKRVNFGTSDPAARLRELLQERVDLAKSQQPESAPDSAPASN
ncbi:MAG: Disulfide bond formation protein D precursor [candidate division WS6 bacterium OLB20]|uniref:Disulfide bond formation protein D n=1 Tax=candidate division WS6 bacterium OLB20 TaxID=1617426 RepID=A0A136LX36_9BACT|nr:MAG: Disulfide bond formation protein D precursor [candidate division WS6 bacterium OLB20]